LGATSCVALLDIWPERIYFSGYGSPSPKPSIITKSMHSIFAILEGIAANAIASELLPAIYDYFPE
jgi:hypothetical protein